MIPKLIMVAAIFAFVGLAYVLETDAISGPISVLAGIALSIICLVTAWIAWKGSRGANQPQYEQNDHHSHMRYNPNAEARASMRGRSPTLQDIVERNPTVIYQVIRTPATSLT